MKCQTCGAPLNYSGKGRVPEYCSAVCRDFFKYKNALERCVHLIQFDEESARVASGDLFRCRNLIKVGGS
jgi:hypothetical protein